MPTGTATSNGSGFLIAAVQAMPAPSGIRNSATATTLRRAFLTAGS